jgi:PAS domain S-box-containing protein
MPPDAGGAQKKAAPANGAFGRLLRGSVLIAGSGLAAAAALVLVLLVEGVRELRTAPHDNLQWTLSQLEVELLRLATAADEARHDEGTLADVRTRFDVFYSRVRTVGSGRIYDDLRSVPRADETLSELRAFLDRTVPVIDGPDAGLEAHLDVMIDDLRPLALSARALSLQGVQVFARQSDARRASFERFVVAAAFSAVGLILLLAVSLAFLWRAHRISIRRASELSESRNLLRETIDASLDAIVTADSAGRIVGFNKAAERIFGVSANEAKGREMADTIIPLQYRDAHRAGMDRYLETGEKRVVQKGRIELSALRADGSEFPVELAIGETIGADGPLFIAFLRDISARTAAERALREARDQAMAGDKAKSEFIAVMSHEMRTPLNGMLGVLDLIGRTDLSPAQRRYLDVARRSGDILLQHVNDVLDISRISADKMSFAEEPIDLASLIGNVHEVNLPLAEARGLSLTRTVDLPSGRVHGDADRLRQVLMNLVGNAVKFTREGSVEIALVVLAEGDDTAEIELSVKDTGIGIAEKDRGRIFEEFVTLDPSYQREASGSGLGLAISRRLVRAMGGEIGVHSRPGIGSRFWVRLTLPRTAPDAVEAARSPRPAAAERDTAGRLDGRHVLIVEDNEINRFVLRDMLGQAGAQVDEAHNGAEGVEMAERQRYDLILMDISMPVMDGVEATRAIRSGNGASRATTIVGVTAHALPGEQDRFREAGIEDLLTKPVRLASLEALLARLAGASHGEGADGPEHDPGDGPDDDLFDEVVLAALGAQVSPERFATLLGSAARDIATGVEAIGAARAAGDIAALGASAHRLAGTAALIGATRLHAALAAVETACKAGEDGKAHAAADTVPGVAEETRSVLAELSGETGASAGT